MTRVGLVLGAGGSVGEAYHLGVLSALAAETGWDPRSAEIVVGTSAGSLVAALLRGGLAVTDLAADILGEPLSPEGAATLAALGPRGRLARREPRGPVWRPAHPGLLLAAARRKGRLRAGLLPSALGPTGTVDPAPVADRVRRLHPSRWPAESLEIVAVRLSDGQRVAFGAPEAPPVDVGTATMASCAIPGYLRPVQIEGEEYVDGGSHSPTNADLLAGRHLDLVIISAPMGVAAEALGCGRADLALRVLWRRAARAEARAVRGSGTAVVLAQPGQVELSGMGRDPLDRSRMPDVLRAARLATLTRLRSGGTAAQALRMLSLAPAAGSTA